MLANRLDKICPFPVHEAAEGMKVEPGACYLATGGKHMRLAKDDGAPFLTLDEGPKIKSCRPAVDALFDSASEIYGNRLVAAILTGMGDDGARGGQKLIQSGAHMICQDEKTSVVWGMPGATVRANAASEVLPLDEVGAAICAQFATRIPVGAQR